MTSYLAIADGEPIARIKFEMTEVREGAQKSEVLTRYLFAAHVAALRAAAEEGGRLKFFLGE